MRRTLATSALAGALAALVPLAAHAQGKLTSFDGTWTVRVEASSQCPERLGPFSITIRSGSVSAPGGAGSIGINGAITFAALSLSFTGRLVTERLSAANVIAPR